MLAAAESRGYERGAHIERDRLTGLEKYRDNTLKAHKPFLYNFAVYVICPYPGFDY